MIEILKKNLKINDFTEKTAKRILPIVEEHSDEIVDSVVFALLNDNEVVNTLNKNKVKLQIIKGDLKYWIGLVFSGRYDKEYYEKIYNIGCTHVDVGVEAHIVMEAVALFMNETISIVSEYAALAQNELLEIIKLFNLAMIIMINSYGDELLAAFMQFTGLRKELFMKEVELARKHTRRVEEL